MKWKGWIGGVLLVMMLFGTLGCLPGGKRRQLLHRLRLGEAADLRKPAAGSPSRALRPRHTARNVATVSNETCRYMHIQIGRNNRRKQ